MTPQTNISSHLSTWAFQCRRSVGKTSLPVAKLLRTEAALAVKGDT